MTVQEGDVRQLMYDAIDSCGDRGYIVDEIRAIFEDELRNWADGFDNSFYSWPGPQ